QGICIVLRNDAFACQHCCMGHRTGDIFFVHFAVKADGRVEIIRNAVGYAGCDTGPPIERLLKPLSRFGVPAHELAMMMTIALRFIPTLIDETDRIMKAQRSRGADFSSGSLLRRVRCLIPLLVPLFISAFRRADELAVAMEARCYRGGDHRTRMHTLAYTSLDRNAYIAVFVLLAIIIAIRIGKTCYGM
ncbi:MAG: energy-coupling factor transporter transmembrane protein EcfT, partial [Selenomonadales bacterium]|nr:energy-coupling factor transporter transmembrane protein EcfT [Selenomonadales bacterium]